MRSEASIDARCRGRAAAALGAAALVALWGCGRDDGPGPITPYVPPPLEDMAAEEMSGEMSPGPEPVGPACEGLQGTSCQLPQAAGVCVDGRCRLLACTTGWADCDEDPADGCEVDVTQASSCGNCARTCREQETCQLGVRGYVCSSGVVCPSDRFDLDQARDNGCEWGLREQRADFQPMGRFARLERVDLGPQGGIAVGLDLEGERVVVTSRAPLEAPAVSLEAPQEALLTASPTGLWLEPQAGAEGPLRALSVWPDMIGLHQRAPADEQGDDEAIAGEDVTLEHPCPASDPDDPIRVRAARWTPELEGHAAAVALERAVVPLRACEGSGLCFAPEDTFGPADYVRAFYPYDGEVDEGAGAADPAWRFEAEEVRACQPCVFDPQTGAPLEDQRCWGQGQCQAGQGFDREQACQVCASGGEGARGCPDFAPVALLPVPGHPELMVVTRRGVVILAPAPEGGRLRAVARLERGYDPGAVQGARFIAGAVAASGDVVRVFLLHNTGYVRTLQMRRLSGGGYELAPAAPDFGVELSLDGRGPLVFEAAGPRTLALVDAQVARVLRVRERSARRYELELERGSIQDGFFGGQAIEGGFEVWALRYGNLLSRTLREEAP